jgi:hypothetical protein
MSKKDFQGIADIIKDQRDAALKEYEEVRSEWGTSPTFMSEALKFMWIKFDVLDKVVEDFCVLAEVSNERFDETLFRLACGQRMYSNFPEDYYQEWKNAAFQAENSKVGVTYGWLFYPANGLAHVLPERKMTWED